MTVGDSFDRADASSLGATDTGETWVPYFSGGLHVVSHAAAVPASEVVGDFVDVASVRSSLDDPWYVQMRALIVDVDHLPMVIGLSSTSNGGTALVAQLYMGTGTFGTYALDADGYSVSGDLPDLVPSTDRVVRFECRPATTRVTILIDDVVGLDVTDVPAPAFSSGSFVYVQAGPLDDPARVFDDFEVGLL